MKWKIKVKKMWKGWGRKPMPQIIDHGSRKSLNS